jgi:3-methyladenine DNA glycosylase AlkD
MKKTANNLIADLKAKASPERAKILQWFFKTKPGQYGFGDVFLGLYVPDLKKIVKPYFDLDLSEIKKLLDCSYHEARFGAGQILMEKYKKADNKNRRQIYDFTLKNLEKLNNLDLVDCTVRDIIGAHLFDKKRSPLYTLTKSKNLWRRRTAIVSTYYFIKHGDLDETFKLAKLLLADKEELIHKAVGWMLREAGKMNSVALIRFLQENYSNLPRVTLRYAIEKFSPTDRRFFLKGIFSLRD